MKISVITVCFNSENTIENTINSVVSQNYNNYEIHLNIPKENKFEGFYTHNLEFNNDRLKITDSKFEEFNS